MSTHSIASRRQRRKSRNQSRRERTAAPQKAPARPVTQRAETASRRPQPAYPSDHSQIARAAGVLAHTRAQGMARYALFTLSLLAEDDWTISMSRRSIGELLGVSLRSVEYHLKTLRELGELVIERMEAGHWPRVYRIVPVEG